MIAIPRQKKKPINWDKILDKAKGGFDSVASGGEKIMDIATKAGIAYVGFNALKHPAGALTGLVALNLAQSPNLVAGTAGVGALTALGVLSTVPPMPPIDDIILDPLGLEVCPLPLWAFANPVSLIIANIQRSLCLAQYHASQAQPPPEPPPQNGAGYGGWISE